MRTALTYLLIIVLATIAWGGFWLWGSRGVEQSWANWVETRRSEGWKADHGGIGLRGFPNRYDVTMTDPAFATPSGGLSWQAPFLQVFSVTYKRHHLIIVWPNSQSIAIRHHNLDIQSDNMRASLVLDDTNREQIMRANLDGQKLRLTGPSGRVSLIDRLLVAMKAIETKPGTYRLSFEASGVTPGRPTGINPALPDQLTRLRADLEMEFDRSRGPISPSLNSLDATQIRHIHIKQAEAHWGDLQMAINGTIAIDTTGAPTGKLTVRATNWPGILDLGRVMGWVSETWRGRLAQGLTGRQPDLELPLTFDRGAVSLGPVPLGRMSLNP